MKWIPALVAFFMLAGCGMVAREVSKQSGMSPKNSTKNLKGIEKLRAEAEEAERNGRKPISEEKLGLPYYPGAVKVAYGSLAAVMDGKQTYSISMATEDEPSKVGEFYRSEAPKYGQLDTKMDSFADLKSEKLQVIGIDLKDGRRSQIQAMKGADGYTIVTINTVEK